MTALPFTALRPRARSKATGGNTLLPALVSPLHTPGLSPANAAPRRRLEDWMKRKTTTLGAAAVGLAAAGMIGASCAGTAGSGADTSSADTALSLAYASVIQSSGMLVCTPAQAQIDLCTGLAAGDACTLTSTDGSKTFSGTCRATLDGAAVACAPNPPAPPKELVDPCTGKAAGDACKVEEAIGDSRDGVCVTARDGATLVCGRVHEPPKAAVDACASLAAGAACSLPNHSGKSPLTGVCSQGPAGTGALACTPAQEINPPWQKACEGKDAGAACSLGRAPHGAGGTCVAPAAGGANVCVLPCASLRGSFECGHHGGGHHEEHGDGGHQGMPSDGGRGDDDSDESSDGGHGTCPGHHGDGGMPLPFPTDGGMRRDGGARPI